MKIKDLIVELRGQSVLLDSDVAQIYWVETMNINKAVTNNPDKFPAGYVVELSKGFPLSRSIKEEKMRNIEYRIACARSARTFPIH